MGRHSIFTKTFCLMVLALALFTPARADQNQIQPLTNKKVEQRKGYRVEKSGFNSGDDEILPKSFSLVPLSVLKGDSVKGAGSCYLGIDKHGIANLSVSGKHNSLKQLDQKALNELLGENVNDDSQECSYLTFHPLAQCGSIPNIYHVDTEFDEGGKLKRYRVRGYNVNNPFWQTAK